MKKEFDKLLKLVRKHKPAQYEVLKNNNVESVFDSLKDDKAKKAFLIMIILLTLPEYRKKFLESKE